MCPTRPSTTECGIGVTKKLECSVFLVFTILKTLSVTVRKPTEETHSKAVTELKAARCMGTLEELERVMATRGVGREGVACFDETAMQLFALVLLTLHWRGARNVPIPKSHRNKLSLSIAVLSVVELEMNNIFVR